MEATIETYLESLAQELENTIENTDDSVLETKFRERFPDNSAFTPRFRGRRGSPSRSRGPPGQLPGKPGDAGGGGISYSFVSLLDEQIDKKNGNTSLALN